MKKLVFSLLAITVLLFFGCQKSEEKNVVQLELMTHGFQETRYSGIFQAIEKFNKEHPQRQYILNVEKYVSSQYSWNDYQKIFEEKQKENQVDILITASEYLPYLSENKLIEPIDNTVNAPIFREQYFAPLWNCITYKDQYWGVLVETGAHFAFINKNSLRAAGYTDGEIEALPQKVIESKFTLYDLERLSKQSIDEGITQYGIVHRPNSGIFYYLMAKQFQAIDYIDNKIITRHDNLIEMMNFFENNCTYFPYWKELNENCASKNVAVILNGCWYPYDLSMDNLISTDDFWDSYIPVLIPARNESERPSTISNTIIATVSSNSKYKEDVEEILRIAYSNWNENAIHSAYTYHMPVAKDAYNNEIFGQNKHLRSMMYAMDYTTFVPNTVDNMEKIESIFNMVTSVETGDRTPSEAAEAIQKSLE